MPTSSRLLPSTESFAEAVGEAASGPDPAPEIRGTGGVPTLKTFGVLEAVVRSQRPLSVTELGVMAGVPKPTMHRIVRMLEVEGLLQREPGERRYQPGPRLLSFAAGVTQASMRTAPRHAILESLSAEVGETCTLGMMVNTHAVYLDRVEAAWPLGLRYEPGSRVPLHCTAMGKVFLANMPRGRRKELLNVLALDRYTDQTITDPERLGLTLEDVRIQGFAVDDQEYMAGVICVAVPVRSREDAVVAALAIAAPAVRMPLVNAVAQLHQLNLASERLAATFNRAAEDDEPPEHPGRRRRRPAGGAGAR